MGLFSKKSPCPICGGKISWLLPTKIAGEHICDTCANKIDMQEDIKNGLTMQQFREYLVYYEQNQRLKERFIISQRIDFGLWDTKLIFDFENKLFCMGKKLDKTIFEGKHLKSFIIKEDNAPLFECSGECLKRYTSTIPEKAMALAPQLSQYVMNRRLMESVERISRDDEDNNRYHHIPTMDIPEPFKQFNVELHFEHPYWKVIKCDMDGPTFSNSYPDVSDYIHDYQNNVEELEALVRALMTVAFPNAREQAIGNGAAVNAPVQMAQPSADAIEEIKRYKQLMEEGIISVEEFNAKKRQLLGI